MMDVMRQHPIRKKKTAPVKSPEKEKDKEGKGASSFAQSEEKDYACFCCGSKTCRYYHCPKKKDLPPEKWFNPEFAKKKVEEKKISSATTTVAVVGAQCLEEELLSYDDTTMVVVKLTFLAFRSSWLGLYVF